MIIQFLLAKDKKIEKPLKANASQENLVLRDKYFALDTLCYKAKHLKMAFKTGIFIR